MEDTVVASSPIKHPKSKMPKPASSSKKKPTGKLAKIREDVQRDAKRREKQRREMNPAPPKDVEMSESEVDTAAESDVETILSPVKPSVKKAAAAAAKKVTGKKRARSATPKPKKVAKKAKIAKKAKSAKKAPKAKKAKIAEKADDVSSAEESVAPSSAPASDVFDMKAVRIAAWKAACMQNGFFKKGEKFDKVPKKNTPKWEELKKRQAELIEQWSVDKHIPVEYRAKPTDPNKQRKKRIKCPNCGSRALIPRKRKMAAIKKVDGDEESKTKETEEAIAAKTIAELMVPQSQSQEEFVSMITVVTSPSHSLPSHHATPKSAASPKASLTPKASSTPKAASTPKTPKMQTE